jgi:rhodanese-related sulfurtransferase
MAAKKGRKAAKRPATKAGSRSWKLIVLVAAAALAAVLYAFMSPSGIFKPGVVSPSASASKADAGGKTARVEAAKAEPVKAEAPKPAAKPEPKPAPKPVVAPVAAVPPAPKCNGQNLSLSDVQGKVGNPAYQFVDVRPADRYAAANIPGSLNIPAADFDAAFARVSAILTQSAGVILYGQGYNDPALEEVCIKMAGKNLPRVYLFREGWDRWPQAPGR